MRIAVYPGSFDPITNGHLDVVRRATAVFDRLVVAVIENPRKQPMFSADVRVAAIRESVDEAGLGEKVEVATFHGLTVDFCRTRDARSIVRGLRAIADFETEMQLAHNNRKLAPEIDTVFFMTSLEHGYVSSSLVKEIAQFGGDVGEMVPGPTLRRLREASAATG
ncbi:MAG: pantetheine-phosphate adenylyltransferase [Chloroflexi bacterium]|nr:pantetheine-phosphate adenylyltransferase [Chloroflexota bacterium]